MINAPQFLKEGNMVDILFMLRKREPYHATYLLL